MTLRKLLLTIAGALGLLGSFLPWYSFSFFGRYTVNAFQMSVLYIVLAILMILASIVAILLAVLKEEQIKKIVKVKDNVNLTMAVGIVMAVITAVAFIALKSESQGFGGSSWGIWLMAIASAATIVLSVLKRKELDKVVIKTATGTKSDTKKTTKK